MIQKMLLSLKKDASKMSLWLIMSLQKENQKEESLMLI